MHPSPRTRRRGLLIAVVACLVSSVAVPAVAADPGGAPLPPVDAVRSLDPPETPAGDACRELGGTDPMCGSVDAAAGLATHVCREAAGLPAEECATPSGQVVDGSLVDAYEATWTHRAHALQRDLGDRLPFVEAQFLSTHNSYNARAYFPTLSGTDANQQYSIRDQLRMDVRELELDVHWWFHAGSGRRAPLLCHGTGEHAGCSWDRHLAEGLEEIVAWLEDNPREVVIVRFETHLDHREGYDTAAAVVEEHLGPYAFKRDGDGCVGLPLDLTRDEVRAAGKQVVLLSSCGTGASWPALVYSYDTRVESQPRGFEGYPSCGPQFSEAQYRSLVVRYHEDRTWLSMMAGTAGDPIDAATAREMVRCGVNHLSVDHLTPEDDRLGATIWSWAEGEPAAGACAYQDGTGRFRSADCDEVRPFLCADETRGTWTVTRRRGPWSHGSRVCERSGATFEVPGSGYENELAATAKGTTGASEVWLAYADGEDGWTVTRPSSATAPGARVR